MLTTLLFAHAARAEATLADVQRVVRIQQGVTCLAPGPLHLQTLTWLRGAELDPKVTVEVLGSWDDPRSAVVRVRMATGELSERSFAPGPERCNDFLGAVGLTAALAIKRHGPTVATPPPARPGDEEQTQSTSTAATRARPFVLALAGGGLWMWPDPPPMLAGGELLLGYRIPGRVQLRAGLLALRRGRAELLPSVDYSLRTLAARLELCAPFELRHTLTLDLCGALLAGRLTARAHGALRETTTMRLLDAGPALLFSGALAARWAWQVGAALLVGLEPRRLSVARGERSELESLPRLAALFSLTVSYTLHERRSAPP